MQNSLVPLDPDPTEWLSEDRIHFLQNSVSPAAKLLEDISLLDEVLIGWLISEVISDAADFTLDGPFCENISFNSFSLASIKQQYCENDELAKILLWSKSRWNHRLEVLYLNKQAKLDLVSCRLISLEDESLAFELYCRLKSGEDSFANLSMKYGSGKERFNGGLFPLQPLESFPKAMQSILRQLKPGDFIKPFKFRGKYSICQLAEWRPSSYDTHSQKQLLLWEFETWLLAMLPSLKRHLVLSSFSIF